MKGKAMGGGWTAWRIFAAAALTLAAVTLGGQAFSSKSEDAAPKQDAKHVEAERAKIQKLEQNAASKKVKLEEKKKAEAFLRGEVREVDRSILKLREDIDENRKALGVKNAQLNKIQSELVRALEERSRHIEMHRDRLVHLYKTGRAGHLEALFGSTNLNDFLVRLHYTRLVIDHDRRIIEDLQAKEKAIETVRRSVEAEKLSVVDTLKTWEVKKRELESRKGEKSRNLQVIQSDRRLLEQQLEEIEKASREIEETIRRRQKKGGSYKGGGMMRPVDSGTMTSPFGWRRHPILRKSRMHNGVDVGVRTGTPVRAANDGEVISAGWQRGYGYTVVIDHGGEISTLYAHGSRIKVREGQQMKRGDVVMLSGSSGLATGPHLHFEVRVNGSPVNPVKYVAF